jgi:hypothetical protein
MTIQKKLLAGLLGAIALGAMNTNVSASQNVGLSDSAQGASSQPNLSVNSNDVERMIDLESKLAQLRELPKGESRDARVARLAMIEEVSAELNDVKSKHETLPDLHKENQEAGAGHVDEGHFDAVVGSLSDIESSNQNFGNSSDPSFEQNYNETSENERLRLENAAKQMEIERLQAQLDRQQVIENSGFANSRFTGRKSITDATPAAGSGSAVASSTLDNFVS